MMVLNVKGTEYKVKFGYNSFCDTDLMERAKDLLRVIGGEEIEDDRDVAGLGIIKTMFTCVRDLLFVGFQKYNPVENVQEVGNILDDYNEDATEDDKRGILDLFIKLTDELMNEGFLSDLMNQITQDNDTKVTPQDHKKPQKK